MAYFLSAGDQRMQGAANRAGACNELRENLLHTLAEADRIKRVTEATAEAEAMEKAGEGIANQRKAIALGIKDSLEIIQETGVGNDEANQLFMFTQWSEMMTEFARTGKTSTVVLPSDFSQSASMFEQMLTAGKVQNDSKE